MSQTQKRRFTEAQYLGKTEDFQLACWLPNEAALAILKLENIEPESIKQQEGVRCFHLCAPQGYTWMVKHKDWHDDPNSSNWVVLGTRSL